MGDRHRTNRNTGTSLCHAFLREVLDVLFTEGTGAKMTILYGGSAKNRTTQKACFQPDIDGARWLGAHVWMPVISTKLSQPAKKLANELI
ncbi:MAG: triose-phosphate isomerase [Calditrichia bacterium]